jgi:Tol biopolymer transport system component
VFSTGSYNTPGKLWLLPLNGRSAELLVDCGGDSCHGPAVSPDGSLLAYERARMETSLSGLSVPLHPFVEMLDLTTRKTRVISSQGHTANNPTWSPNGWLSYYDATRRAIVIDDLQGGQTFLPNVTGEQWTWLPDGRGVIFPEIIASGESFGNQDPRLYSHLFLVTESDNRRTDLSDIEQIEDGSPAVSPDGRQLAFARNYFDNRWTPGRQIWIMNLDTFTARPITQTAEYGHSSIRWSPDGLMLVFMRFHETAPTEPPEIWAINADGSNAHRLSTGGYLPQWLP